MAQLYRRARSTRLLVVGLVTASLVTITLDFRQGSTGPLAAIGRGALAVITPLQNAVSDALRPLGNFFGTLTQIGSLRSQNALLRSELERLEAESGTLYSLQRRVQELEDLLRVAQTVDVPSTGAKVIGTGFSNFEWSLEIDAGASDGIGENMPVVGPRGLIGHVVRVSAGSAEVELILDPDSRVAARLSGSGEVGLVQGQRDQELRMELIDASVVVKPGEPVETSGYRKGPYTGLYPPGIPIGVVSRVVEDPAALAKQVWVRPNVDFTRLENVIVLLTR